MGQCRTPDERIAGPVFGTVVGREVSKHWWHSDGGLSYATPTWSSASESDLPATIVDAPAFDQLGEVVEQIGNRFGSGQGVGGGVGRDDRGGLDPQRQSGRPWCLHAIVQRAQLGQQRDERRIELRADGLAHEAPRGKRLEPGADPVDDSDGELRTCLRASIAPVRHTQRCELKAARAGGTSCVPGCPTSVRSSINSCRSPPSASTRHLAPSMDVATGQPATRTSKTPRPAATSPTVLTVTSRKPTGADGSIATPGA